MNNKENENKELKIQKIDGGVSAEQIEAWKREYGRVVEVNVTDPAVAECHAGYFHRPDMKTMQAVNATSKTNEVKASEVMFDNCWLGGSPMLKTDAILKMEAMATLGQMFGQCVRELKNL